MPQDTMRCACLSGGGELAELIAGFDWSATPLGRIEDWPPSLTSTVGLILRSPVPIVTLWGEDGIMIYNDAYSRFAGARHPRLLGAKVREGWHEIAAFNDHVMRVGLAGGTLAYRDQQLTLDRDGRPEPAWMNLDYSPITDAAGHPVGVISIVVETTAKVRAEQSLRVAAAALTTLNAELEQRVAARTRDRDRIWRLSDDLMLVAGLDARIEAVNPAWCSLLGWPQAALQGKDFLGLVHPDDLAETRREFARLAAGHSGQRFENRLRRPDGSYRWLSWTAVPDERFIHAVGRDIEAEKAAAERLRATEAALRQSQKMEAVGQLTGGLAHDFNNLLTGIIGGLDVLSVRLRQGRVGDLERYIRSAQGAAARAAALTHRLLAFSRQQTLDPRVISATSLVLGMQELITRSVGPGIAIQVTGAPDLWQTRIDPPQLENALLNLCLNARDAMPDGGRISIELTNACLDDRAAEMRDMAPGDYVSLCVTDTGTGMAPEVIGRAFDPFFTTKPLGQGTGLGLSMVYGFVRQSGGQVRIHSEPGHGSSIYLYLPRHLGAPAMPEPMPGPAATGAGQGETVLVVDDEPTVRMLVVEVLEELGYAPLQAEDGPSGLQALADAGPLALLVTDVGLPGGMNGRQLAEAARRQRPDLKVLFITGYAENAALGHGNLPAGMHVLTKPFAIAALAERIETLIREA